MISTFELDYIHKYSYQLDKAWNIDGNALVEKMKNLSLIETFALVDACEHFWHGNNEGADVRTRVYEVGLVKQDLEETF